MDHFKNPKAIMRPAPFWSWNDKLDKDECVRQVREMKDKGWGSFFMHSRVGLVTPYLGDEWMDIVKACAETAKEEGIYAWLYDEDKWPSGFAAGMVPSKSEDYRARKLIITKKGEVPEGDDVMAEFDWNGASWTIARHIERLGQTWFNGYS
ncbi:MAG: glycoside hydrolase, partial [Abditibacteriota bacterium]|nr:glycoside hydrolase [Abditibacteriota bacterium]